MRRHGARSTSTSPQRRHGPTNFGWCPAFPLFCSRYASSTGAPGDYGDHDGPFGGQICSSFIAMTSGIKKARRSATVTAKASGVAVIRSRPRKARHCAAHATANSSVKPTGMSEGRIPMHGPRKCGRNGRRTGRRVGELYPIRAPKLVHNRSGLLRFSRTRPLFRPTIILSGLPLSTQLSGQVAARPAMDRLPDMRLEARWRDRRGEGLPPDRRQGRRHTPICGETPQRPLCPIKLNRRRHRTFLDEESGGIRAVRFRPRPAAAFRSRVRVRPGRH